MSASEKLKALTTFDYLGPDANDMDGEAWGDAVDTDALTRALPQIVAVVELAELITSDLIYDNIAGIEYQTPAHELGRRLAALEKVLS